MEGYKAYVIGPDGHIINRIDIHTDDEAEARRLAIRVVDRSPVALWRGARIIHRFEPPQKKAISHVIKAGRMIPKDNE
jgi:hypothetical protein